MGDHFALTTGQLAYLQQLALLLRLLGRITGRLFAGSPEPAARCTAAGDSAVAEEESSANAGLAGGPAVIATRLSRPDANGTAKGNGLPISMISHSTPTPQAPNRPAQRRARCQARVSTRVPSISSAVATTRAPASTSLRALFINQALGQRLIIYPLGGLTGLSRRQRLGRAALCFTLRSYRTTGNFTGGLIHTLLTGTHGVETGVESVGGNFHKKLLIMQDGTQSIEADSAQNSYKQSAMAV